MPESEYHKLSTGEAATLCSVKSDTVLKWIVKGRLRASRTAGGHFRIDYRDLEPFTRVQRLRAASPPPEACRPRPLRCWEYMSDPGVVTGQCRNCVVYRFRAAWCFEVLGSSEQARQERHCKTSCEECTFYRRVRGLPTRVVVITRDDGLIERLQSEAEPRLDLHFARSGYETAVLIGSLLPAFAVIDQAQMDRQEPRLFEYLTRDARVPGMRTVLALASGVAADYGSTGAVIFKPFGAAQLTQLVESFPVEVASE
ncbi:MAG TPA: excisionase family DNA-binding protein [Paludibaculum sp.]|jgi:excisionase family DNA binding protein